MITVTGPILNADGTPFVGRMRLTPLELSEPTTVAGIRTVNAGTDGTWPELKLAAGRWMATFPSAPGSGAKFLEAPDGDTSVSFDSLVLEDGAGGAGSGLAGDGSPEGVVTAAEGRSYWDRVNKRMYMKDSAIGNTGWRELIG